MAVEIDAIQSAKSIGWTDALLSRLAANSVGLGARLSITAPANASALSSTGYSLTGSNASSMVDLAGTWNTTGTPTLIKANVTNTASNAASLLMDLQVGGVSRAKVHVDGRLIVTSANSFVDMAFSPLSAANVGIKGDSYNVKLVSNASTMAGWDLSAFYIGSNQDVYLIRDAANTLALRNSTNAQALNIYGTYTSGSVFERMFMRYSVANTRYEIGTEHTGASARALYISTGSNLILESSGNLTLTQGSVNIVHGSGSALTLMPTTATAAGGVRGFQLGSTSNFGVYYGSGAPTVSAAKGSLYLRSNGSGTSDRMYVNTDGGTTWTAVTTVA